MTAVLARAFFDRSAVEVAPDLLGRIIEHEDDDGLVAVRITEVEAYDGPADAGSHAFRGLTRRNAVMFGDPGFVYVYFTYGMHYCMNLVCGPAGWPSAVLVRAGEVVAGAELAAHRRGGAPLRDLARGPARLTVALGIGRADNATDACAPSSTIRVRRSRPRSGLVMAGPRVGVAAGAETPWRFWLAGEPTVSTYRPHAIRSRTANP